MGKKPIVQLCGCHDLHTANGKFMPKRTAEGYMVFSIQIGGHYIKGNHPISKNACIQIANTTNVHKRNFKCFKVYIVKGPALKSQSPNKIKVHFT